MQPPSHVAEGGQPTMDEWYQWLDFDSSPVLLDGGLGFVLDDRGNDLSKGRLWSGRLLITNPNELKKVAKEWLECGSDIITTATYQVTTELLQEEFNLGLDEAKKVMSSAWNVLDTARHEFWEQLNEYQQRTRRYPAIAVSCGPYSAVLPNISEYEGKYDGVPASDIQQFHLKRLQALQELIPWSTPNSDKRSILCFETIGSTIEAEVITQMMGTEDFGHIPYWISFQCKDALRISCGDPLSEAVKTILVGHARPNLVAIGVNCVDAFNLESLQRVLQSAVSSHATALGEDQWRLDTVCYPNSGELWSHSGWYWRKDMCLNHTEWAQITCSTQSKIVGGCCRIGSDYIRALQRERSRLSGHTRYR